MARKNKETLDNAFLVSHAESIYRASMQWRDENVVPRWEKDNDLYDGNFSSDEKKHSKVLGQSRLFIPKTYSHIQRILVDILDSWFFDPEEIVDVTARKDLPSESREIVKVLLNYRLNGNPINFYQEAFEACLDAMRNKVGIFKVYPDIREVNGQSVFQPRIDCVPYEDVLFDSNATWKDYWKYPIVHRMSKSIDYLKRRGYKNLDKIESMKSRGEWETVDTIKAQRAMDQGSPFARDAAVIAKDMENICIYEVWTFLDVNNDGLLESCSYIAAGDVQGPKIIIRDVKENTLPYKTVHDDYNRPPFVVGQAYPESHKMYGKSAPEIVEGLQRETNSIRNQRREAVALALRKPILAARHANLDLMSLVNRRMGAVVLGDDISDQSVREMQFTDPTMTSVQEQMRTDQDFYETTSIPPNLMGVPSSGEETATGVTAHVNNANKKISQIIRNLAYTLFTPSFKLLLRLEEKYESDEFIEMVAGKRLGWGKADDGVPAKDWIQGEFDLVAGGAFNKQMQLNKWMMLMDRATMVNQTQVQMQAAGVILAEDTHYINVMTMFHRVLPILGEKNVAEFMLQAQQPPQPEQPRPLGIASQTGLAQNPEDTVMNMNPEMSHGQY